MFRTTKNGEARWPATICGGCCARSSSAPDPRAAVFDSRTLQSSPESGAGRLRRAQAARGSKVHLAVDSLGHLLALLVTPANAQDRAQVAELAAQVQEETGASVEVAFVDQGYTGGQPAEDAAEQGIRLEVVKLSMANRGFVLLPRRWVVERGRPLGHAWLARFRRLARDYGRLSETLAGLHFVAFAIVLLARFIGVMTESA